MEIILFILGISAAFFASAALHKKTDVIKNSILSIVQYFSFYVTVSGILFWIDSYQTILAEGITLLAEIAVWLVFRKEKGVCKAELKGYFLPIIVCVFMFPFIAGKFEIYGMGQDEGVYQTKAIALLKGDTENQYDISSYSKVPEEFREEYQELIKEKLSGFYLYDETLPTLSEKERIGDVSGFYHGVSTFPAVLSLWGEIAGMKNMAGIQTIFYVCAVFLLFFICGNLNFAPMLQNLCTLVFAISPLVIWTSKSTLTEIFLVCILELYIYILTMEESKAGIMASSLPIIAFSFFHITVYTILPIIVLIYFALYMYTGKKEYLSANIVIFTGFAAGMHMIAKTAATYAFIYNFKPVYQIAGFCTQENIMLVFDIFSLTGIIVSVLLLMINKKSIPIIIRKDNKALSISLRLIAFLLTMANIAVVFKIVLQYKDIQMIHLSTFVGYGILTGLLLLPCAIIVLLKKPEISISNKNHIVISGLFFYCILIYSVILRPQINYYYYYGRYLVPFLPCVILMGGVAIMSWRHIRSVKICVAATALLSMLVALPYDWVLLKEKDDTRMTWSVLQECSNLLKEGDRVIVNSELAPILFLQLSHLSEAEIYMSCTDELEEQMKWMREGQGQSGDIYFITGEFYDMPEWKAEYKNSFIASEDKNNRRSAIIPFPVEMDESKQNISVYRYISEQNEYQMENEKLMVNGFYQIEGKRRWTGKRGTLYCMLQQDSYEIRVKQGSQIPFHNLERDSIKIKFIFNGKLLEEYEVSMENAGEDIVISLQADKVSEGKNVLEIECETWSPNEYGSADARQLGISIEKIVFEKTEEAE